MPDLPEMWTLERVAEWLDVHPETVRRAARSGRLGHYRIHGSLRVSFEQLIAYVETMKCPPREREVKPAEPGRQESAADAFRRELRIRRALDRQKGSPDDPR